MDVNDPTNINSLPHELLVDLLSRVASSSFTDLFNSKLCNKDFRRAAEEDSILEHVSIQDFPVTPWFKSPEIDSFMNRCLEKGNPEALYRQGILEYFTQLKTQSGLDNLRRAAEKGHVEASYLFGILLVCMGGQSSVHGLNILNAIEKIFNSSDLKIFQVCRERLKYIFHRMWLHNKVIDRRISSCPHPNPVVRVIETWDGSREEVDGMSCELCKWDGEVRLFCKLFKSN